MSISPLAGKPAPASMLVDVPKLVTAYYTEQPDPATLEQKRRVTQFSPSEVDVKELAGDPIRAILTNAPGNGGPIGGSKLVTDIRIVNDLQRCATHSALRACLVRLKFRGQTP